MFAHQKSLARDPFRTGISFCCVNSCPLIHLVYEGRGPHRAMFFLKPILYYPVICSPSKPVLYSAPLLSDYWGDPNLRCLRDEDADSMAEALNSQTSQMPCWVASVWISKSGPLSGVTNSRPGN